MQSRCLKSCVHVCGTSPTTCCIVASTLHSGGKRPHMNRHQAVGAWVRDCDGWAGAWVRLRIFQQAQPESDGLPLIRCSAFCCSAFRCFASSNFNFNSRKRNTRVILDHQQTSKLSGGYYGLLCPQGAGGVRSYTRSFLGCVSSPPSSPETSSVHGLPSVCWALYPTIEK